MLIKPNISNIPGVADERPAPLIAWLNYKGSLTEKLKNETGEARIELIAQGWEEPDPWDEEMLHLQNAPVFHREILMWALEQPCWYARTIIPQATFMADPKLFDRLKRESMGALIFKESKIERDFLINYPITESHIEYQWLKEAMHGDEPFVWMRLSGFTLSQAFSFFLVEILLPGLERVLK